MTPVWMIDSVVICMPESDWEHRNLATSIFIECYVPMNDLQHALIQANEELRQNGFEVVDVDRCMRYHEEHWDELSDGHRKVRELVGQARDSSSVAVGPIRWVEYRESCTRSLPVPYN